MEKHSQGGIGASGGLIKTHVIIKTKSSDACEDESQRNLMQPPVRTAAPATRAKPG